MRTLRFLLFWLALLVLGALFQFPPTPPAHGQPQAYSRANYGDSMQHLRREFRRLGDSLAALEAMSHIVYPPPPSRSSRRTPAFHRWVYYYNTREQPRTVYVYKDGVLYWVAERKR